MGMKLVYESTREQDSYGEYLQGTGEIFRVYQLDDGPRHFKQTGFQSSYRYDDPSWNASLEEIAEPQLKKVTTYDYEGL